MTLAIISALLDEQRGLLQQLTQPKRVQRAGRTFWCGQWHGQDVVLVLSKVGKVAAATTTTALIEAFGVQRVVFTGVAGGVGCGVAVGDVVVADAFIQHDMDASPLFARYEIPLYGTATLPCDGALTALLSEAVHAVLTRATSGFDAENLYPQKRLHQGLIASGDQFIDSHESVQALLGNLQQAGHAPLAVEMEGAAVAQVCHDYGVALAAVRTISDRADAQAHADFSAFVTQVASPYATAIIGKFVKMLSNK